MLMITDPIYVKELSASQAETLLGGSQYNATWGSKKYLIEDSDKVKWDWTVTWVRTKPGSTDKDVFSYSAKAL